MHGRLSSTSVLRSFAILALLGGVASIAACGGDEPSGGRSLTDAGAAADSSSSSPDAGAVDRDAATDAPSGCAKRWTLALAPGVAAPGTQVTVGSSTLAFEVAPTAADLEPFPKGALHLVGAPPGVTLSADFEIAIDVDAIEPEGVASLWVRRTEAPRVSVHAFVTRDDGGVLFGYEYETPEGSGSGATTLSDSPSVPVRLMLKRTGSSLAATALTVTDAGAPEAAKNNIAFVTEAVDFGVAVDSAPAGSATQIRASRFVGRAGGVAIDDDFGCDSIAR